jgi:hypothetical protein
MAQKKWNELSTTEKARIIREFGGKDYDAVLGKLTDEQLVASPQLWPPPDKSGSGQNAAQWTEDGSGYGDYYVSSLAEGYNLPALNGHEPAGQKTAVADITGSGQAGAGNVGQNAVDSYDPQRGVSREESKGFSGVRPGVVLDPKAYERDATSRGQMTLVGNERQRMNGRDANRYAIDPNAVPQVTAQTVRTPEDIVAERIAARTTDTTGAYRDTQSQVGRAEQSVQDIMGARGSAGLRSAGEMARDAAMGKAPSAAESMFAAAGAEGQSAYERIARQAAIDVRNRTNSIRSSQAALAAGQRGAVSGAANLQAMNNTALAQTQLSQQALDVQTQAQADAIQAQRDAQYRAAAGRADEMAAARTLSFQIEDAIRRGDIEAAKQLTALAETTRMREGDTLRANETNTAAMNRASEMNAANSLTAQQATAGNQIQVGTVNSANSLAASQANAGNTTSVLQSNQGASSATGQTDTAAKLSYDQLILEEQERDRQARILATQNQQQTVSGEADRLANVYTGQATNRTALAQAREEREARENAGLVQGAATVGAAAISLSDSRAKNIEGYAKAPDFRKATAPRDSASLVQSIVPRRSGDFRAARDANYTYKGDPSRTRYTGPMAQQLPANVQTRGPGGARYVDTARLAMNLASAVGRLQKKVGV